MSKFKPFHEFQKPLVGISHEAYLDYIETVIPSDHLCRLVKEVVFSLDTEAIEAKYSFDGQKTYHPKLMLSLLFHILWLFGQQPVRISVGSDLYRLSENSNKTNTQ